MFTLKRFNDFVSESVKFDNAYKIPNINCQDIIEIKKKLILSQSPPLLETANKTTNRSVDLLSFIIIYPYKYEASFKI